VNVAFPAELDVVVELPRWSFVKRKASGAIALISPIPCPFNYGSVPGTLAADGDCEDVLLLGPRLPTGRRLRARVLARVHFVDAGRDDAKWICGEPPLAAADELAVRLFFSAYARLKRVLNLRHGLHVPTYYAGIERAPARSD
jgi:inorganic pyrophosphatase